MDSVFACLYKKSDVALKIRVMKNQITAVLLFLIATTGSISAQTPVSYDTSSYNAAIAFAFPDTAGNLYLRQLREENALASLTDMLPSDQSKALAILDWTHRQWTHNGSNQPTKNDALTILKEVREGEKFRCVEYGIVSSKALQSLGYRARLLSLKTKDVETTKYGAGHVLAEVWLPDVKKWAFIDGQFNVMPMLNGVPLNVVEFREAIQDKKAFTLNNSKGEVSRRDQRHYLSFVTDYIYYLDTPFDNRQSITTERKKINGKSSLMLVPLGAKNPTVFQRGYKMDHALYTNAIRDFYPEF